MFMFNKLLVLSFIVSRSSPNLDRWQDRLFLGAWVIYLVSLYTIALS